ncbi:MAG: WbqC family protein [Bacteroidales bacterium]|nr:WbqC family protein [Bacteroidales bacterium]
MKPCVLISGYYAPTSYFSCIKEASEVLIELQENYQRQTIRNRCHILTANGIQILSIPIVHSTDKKLINIRIDYSTPWVSKHIQAIRSAYGKTPFFLYFFDDLISPLSQKYEYLWQLNDAIMQTCLKKLKIEKKIKFTEYYIHSYENANDYRNLFSKKKFPYINNYQAKTYFQAFNDRYPFSAELSILDLIFNTGYEARNYL